MAVVRAVPVDEGTGKMLAGLLPATAMTKPTTPAAVAAVTMDNAGAISTTLLSELGGSAQLNERGDYATALAADPAFAIGDAYSYQGIRYVVFEAHTGTSTPDAAKAIDFGPTADARVELAADGTHLEIGTQAAGPALALPSTAIVTLPNADEVTGNITVYTTDGTPITLVVSGGQVGGGGTGTPPGAPTSLEATGGAGSADLTWTVPADPGSSAIVTYVVQYRIVGASMWSTFSHSASTTTSITVTGLTGGSNYEFRVAASNGLTGDWSNTDSATVLLAGVMFSEDYTAFDDGALDTAGWSFSDTMAIPAVDGGVLKGTGPANSQRTVTGSHNSVITWRVPGGHQFNGLARYNNGDHYIVVEDTQKLVIGTDPFPASPTVLTVDGIVTPSEDYDVVLVMDGTNVALFIDGEAGPSTSTAPHGDSGHDIVGFNLANSTRQLLRFTVQELDA